MVEGMRESGAFEKLGGRLALDEKAVRGREDAELGIYCVDVRGADRHR